MAGVDSNTMLPEDCLSLILSHTSPLDACRLSSASSAFRSAAYSDIVWDMFLPSDYQEIVERSVTSLNFTSKKELFLLLCQSILVDGGNKSFALDCSTGLKSYILSARDLSITWGNQPMYWSWKFIPGSRFSEVAELRTTWWLEIKGKIKTRMLSPNTTYGAYLIMKVSPRAYGLDSMPLEVSVRVGDRVLANTASVCCPGSTKQQLEGVCYANRAQMLSTEGEARVCPRERKDGWMEIELGEFFSGSESENDEEVNMSLMEVRGYQLKGGLIVEGIEVRPKYQ